MDPKIWYLNDGSRRLINVAFISSVHASAEDCTIVKMSNGEEIVVNYPFDYVAKEINQTLYPRTLR
ncbi:MAG: hypothetical protein EOO02_07705 [Chitinophagaceae bacterium]|nr:MAG: hypothetical protein EOO02_07705 [Chitinophagaceae bacterium]